MKYERVNANSTRQQAKRRGLRGFYMTTGAPRDQKGKTIPFRKKDFSKEVLDLHAVRE